VCHWRWLQANNFGGHKGKEKKMFSLKFRRISADDLETLRIWRMLPDVTRFLFVDTIITSEAQKKWYENVKDGGEYKCWIISCNQLDIGFVNLADIDVNNRRADPGMFICEAEYRGKGLAKHIMLNLQRHAFEDLELHKLYGPILAVNSAAVAAYLKTGFQIEGYFKDHIYKNGRFWDLVMIGMLDDHWHRIKSTIDYTIGSFEGY
jgi:UDP-4-amino-4,6-dideoxy-N-acetyl-beta-L-altrosamine N-acetyltransferase